MRRLTLSLKALAIILFAGALIAWFSDPSRKVDSRWWSASWMYV